MVALELSEQKAFEWCLNPDCGHGRVVLEEGVQLTCEICEWETCVKCKVAWHKGKTCLEYQRGLRR
ncbi:hypothetical protein B0J14DRAFT_602620 [Halenospora varia]|nr:hypothetical protein B0J14DRAFT_602620 [Halenospora varia]